MKPGTQAFVYSDALTCNAARIVRKKVHDRFHDLLYLDAAERDGAHRDSPFLGKGACVLRTAGSDHIHFDAV